MRVTSVNISVPNSENVVNLSYRDPTSQNVYVVKSILGLDADEITSKFYGVSGKTSNKFYELSLKKRAVIFQIALNPNFKLGKSYSELRDDLYRIVSSSRTGAVQLQFKNGNEIVAVISGFVSKLESLNFTKSPEVQITITCSDPMLKALVEKNVAVAGLSPASTTIIDAESTSPHGVRFGVNFIAPTTSFSVQDAAVADWAFEVNLTGSSLVEFVVGDELHFSSEYNNRYLYLIRGFDIIHLVDRILPTSIWPIIFPGSNTFVCSEGVGWDYITYFPTYWGV